MGRRVLVTRPQPGADATSRRLAALGFEPIVLPLTETSALESVAPPDVAALDAIAVTSANALRFAPRALLAACVKTPCFVVGAETAAVARAAGFADPQVGPGDAGGLARLVVARCGPGARVLYFCGRVRLPAFEAELARAGLAVVAIETYDTVETGVETGDILAASGGVPIDAVLLHSAESARLIAGIACADAAAGVLAGTRFLCLSPRIAAALEGIEPSRIDIAGNPNEQALLDLLRQPALTPPLFTRG